MNKTLFADAGSLAGTALETMGGIMTEDQGRDAVHLAAIAVRSDERLFPSQHIGLVGDKKVSASAIELVGIVDPFLMAPVVPGEWFWLIIYPRTITSLRHEWKHPAFDDAAVKAASDAVSESERWIQDYADGLDITYNTLMRGARDWLESKRGGASWGEYLVQGGTLEGVSTSDEFWKHYERVTGEVVADDHRQNFFSCSC